MRYENWDVLVFPASHMPCAPLPEYSTKCAAIHDNALRAAVSGGITPLLTCFLPALQTDEPFQISVHNWLAHPSFGYERTVGNGTSKQCWQVRIDIDGIYTAVERFPLDVTWPQIISCANQNLGVLSTQSPIPLRFPPFYHSVTQTTVWDAADETGRITVEVSEGYVDIVDGNERFTKLKNYALFNFQPAPLDVLTRTGIAWPNPRMFEHPLPPRQVPLQQYSLAHVRNISVNSAESGHGHYPPTPDSSRSTSAYSNIPYSSLPITSIISMPPPPLPQHALDAKVNDRRMESRSNESDVSMHAACTRYPNCTSEDAEGHIVHTPDKDKIPTPTSGKETPTRTRIVTRASSLNTPKLRKRTTAGSDD